MAMVLSLVACLSGCPSVSLPISGSVPLSFYLFVCLSLCLCVCVSVSVFSCRQIALSTVHSSSVRGQGSQFIDVDTHIMHLLL